VSSAATPFPWETIESIRKNDLARLHALRLIVSRFADPALLLERSASLLGVQVSSRFRKLGAPKVHSANDVSLILSNGEAPEILVEVEWAAVHRSIALGLGQHDEGLSAPEPPGDEVVGTFCAMVAKVLRSACGARPHAHLVEAGKKQLGDTWRQKWPNAATALFTVVIAEDAYDMRISFGEQEASHRPLFSVESLHSLGDTPLSLSLVLVTSTILPSEIESLAIGDAWLPGIESLSDKQPVALATAGGEFGLSAQWLTSGERASVLFTGNRVELPWTIVVEELPMEANAAQVLEDAPLVVRVEIGACEIAAREWATLEKGDVLSLRQRIGEPVTLRISGKEVARGELVQIEGELGVRILSKVE